MFFQFPQVGPVTTGNAKVDTAINTGIVLAGVVGALAAMFKGKSKPKAKRAAPKRHTPAPIPQTRVQKELDALTERG